MRAAVLALGLSAPIAAFAQSAMRLPEPTLLASARKHAPFTATLSLDRVDPELKGNPLFSHIRIDLARDSRGFVAVRSYAVQLNHAAAPPVLLEFSIFDPIHHQAVHCYTRTEECSVLAYRDRSEREQMALPTPVIDEALPIVQSEDLAPREVVNLPATGRRETFAGGGSRTDWYNRELDLHLETKWQSATQGTRTLRFESLTRGEPDAGMFAIPAEYTVSTMPRRNRGTQLDSREALREAGRMHDISTDTLGLPAGR